MNLKNYTSEVSAYSSISKIEKCLVTAGATNISKQYNNGICTAVTFRMMVNQIPLFFQLPAKADACFDVMWKEVKRPRQDTKQKTMEQSERTAWKIVCDWVEVQLSMIQLDQAETLQVFLPYVYDPNTDETFYQKLKGGGFKQLTNGNQ
jgi:hypothetical protein